MAPVIEMAAKAGIGAMPQQYELIDAVELARRWRVPDSWVRQRATSPRFTAEQRIPHVRFGRYIRFQWNSPELMEWFERCKEQ